MIDLASPIEPHELSKDLARGMDDLVRRVTASCAARGVGRDLLLRVYLAGLYHGVELQKDEVPREPTKRMIEAGRFALESSPSFTPEHGIARCWTAMIDAARSPVGKE